MVSGRTLILCIDRDDDLGYKAGVRSPIIGRAACLDAASTLALADPEDSDVNAIFQAVKTHDELVGRGEEVEVVILTGDHMHMLEGDRKIGDDLDRVLEKTRASSCILISDGVEDEYVLPIIQSRLPVSGIRRVIVTQMPNLEGTYYIIKKLLDDPKVARTVLIPVGLGMLIYAIAYLIGYPEGATIVVVGAIGFYLLFKGLGFDEFFGYTITSLQVALRRGRVTFVSYITAILFVIVGIIIGLYSLLVYYSDEGLLFYVLTFAYGAIGWFTAAGLIGSIGRIIDVYLNETHDLGRVIVLPFFISAIGIIIYGISIYMLSLSDIENFPFKDVIGIQYAVFAMIGGLVLAFAGVYIQSVVNRWIEKKEKEEEVIRNAVTP
jgi:putative membrane protein